MPYISNNARQELQTRTPQNPGELNYVFYTLIRTGVTQQHVYLAIAQRYWKDYAVGKGYQAINDIMGALYCCHMEFHRRTTGYSGILTYANVLLDVAFKFYQEVVVPYEKKKIEENGDIF
jgi:hypothetical protein